MNHISDASIKVDYHGSSLLCVEKTYLLHPPTNGFIRELNLPLQPSTSSALLHPLAVAVPAVVPPNPQCPTAPASAMSFKPQNYPKMKFGKK